LAILVRSPGRPLSRCGGKRKALDHATPAAGKFVVGSRRG